MSAEVKNIYPRINVARGRTVCMRTFADTCTVLIDMWEGAAPRDKFSLKMAYFDTDDGEEKEVEILKANLSKNEIGAGVLDIPIQKHLVENLLNWSNFTLRFSAEIAGVNTVFNYVRQVKMNDYTFLTFFRPNYLDGWALGESLNPAQVAWEQYQGKTWLSCRINTDSKHTILSRDFSLVPGERYLFEVAYYLPNSEESILLRLMDGHKGQGVHTFGSLGRPSFIRFGVTGSSGITTLKVVAGGNSWPGRSCHVYFNDLSIYPFLKTGPGTDSIPWEPEWEKDYPPSEDVPVDEPESD